MNKSTITREQLRALAVKKIESLKFAITQSAFTNIRRGLEDELQLAKFALAAMDNETVGNEFIPKNLDKALGVVGMALPESKEEFNFHIERWIQRLIDRVIRYADEFQEQPAPIAPAAPQITIQKSTSFQHAEKLATDAKELAERVQRNDVKALTTSEEHRQLRDLVMMVKMLCRTVRKYNPESQQAANFTAYLQKEGLISAVDCLRDSARHDTDSEDSRG